MEVTYLVSYHPLVVREDIPKLTKTIKERIRFAIEEKLMTRPERFGKPLRSSLRGYRKLRVGDHRVIFRIDARRVYIIAILHRSVVYQESASRNTRVMP